MKLLSSRDVSTIYDFIVASAQRFHYFFQSPRQHPLFIYFVTFSFPKNVRPRYFTLKDALNYIAYVDRDTLALARREPYSDGNGQHVHVLLLMSRSLNFRRFKAYAYRKAGTEFVLHVERVNPTVEDYVTALRYMFKTETRPEVLKVVNNAKNIILSLLSLWRSS